MQILEIDWQRFLEDLPLFQRQPVEARRQFLQKVHGGQPISSFELGEHFELLCASGFLVPGASEKKASVPLRYRAFSHVVRALDRHRVFDSPSRIAFEAYLNEHFTRIERTALHRSAAGQYYYNAGELYGRISSLKWLTQFLEAPRDLWQEPAFGLGERPSFPSDVLRATRELVRRLMARASPIALTELRDLWPRSSPHLLSPALVAGMRNLLLFPALRGDNLEPLVGIWPSITKRLFFQAAKPPETVTPQQIFEAPFLMEDMASSLAICAAEPFRVRTEDSRLFVRTEQAIASALGTLPEWVERQFNLKTSDRIDWAISFLKDYEFLGPKGEYGKDLRLEVSEPGRNWLGLPAKERLMALLDLLLGKVKKRKELSGYEYEYARTSLLPYSVRFGAAKENDALRSALLAAYAGRAADTFVRFEEFLAYSCQQNSPLASEAQKHPYMTFWIRGSSASMPAPEELDEAWTDLLRDFLRLRLLPLGAAKVGVDGEGAMCFAMTEAGRYLVGAQTDFRFEQVPGRIVVQPNFDVVFLAPEPRAEAEIGRFAERKGRHMGTLFNITKRSILAAAAAGITAEQMFETLRQCCAGELPPNVQREISGWFAQCRRVSLHPAVLLYCPDAETAARVQAVAGSKVTPITDTILELHDPGAQVALLRKLREAAIFVRLGE
jgi:hypothetical protein